MMEYLGPLIVGAGAILTAIGWVIKSDAKLRADLQLKQEEAEAAAKAKQHDWETKTIDRVMTASEEYWKDERTRLNGEITQLRKNMDEERRQSAARITALEDSLAYLQAQTAGKDEQIKELRAELADNTERIHQLEITNAKLTATNDLLLQQISTLREQNAVLREQGQVMHSLVTRMADTFDRIDEFMDRGKQ